MEEKQRIFNSKNEVQKIMKITYKSAFYFQLDNFWAFYENMASQPPKWSSALELLSPQPTKPHPNIHSMTSSFQIIDCDNLWNLHEHIMDLTFWIQMKKTHNKRKVQTKQITLTEIKSQIFCWKPIFWTSIETSTHFCTAEDGCCFAFTLSVSIDGWVIAYVVVIYCNSNAKHFVHLSVVGVFVLTKWCRVATNQTRKT